jgi:putative ABC transport system substrate-binding protein
MRRRDFIALIGCAAAWPVGGRAQQPEKTYRIGWLQPSPVPGPWLEGFRQGLLDFNYLEGKNVIVDYRWGDGNSDRLPEMAAELVRKNPDVLVSTNTAALLVLQKATATVPIVMLGTADPVAIGLVASLRRPGANITGMSSMSPELSQKRLELLKEIVPTLARVTVISNPDNPAAMQALKETQAAARILGLSAAGVEVHDPGELDEALSNIARDPPGAVVLTIDAMILTQRSRIAAFARAHQFPSISPFREFAEAGGLLAYGPSSPDMQRRAVALIDKILRGAKPADLPVEQPTTFELIVNLNTAKALGITVPQTLLVTANEVIE